MVGVARLELATPWSQTRCASQLRYTPTTSGENIVQLIPKMQGIRFPFCIWVAKRLAVLLGLPHWQEPCIIGIRCNRMFKLFNANTLRTLMVLNSGRPGLALFAHSESAFVGSRAKTVGPDSAKIAQNGHHEQCRKSSESDDRADVK